MKRINNPIRPKYNKKSEIVNNHSNKLLAKRFVEDYDYILKKKKLKRDMLTYQKTEIIMKELGFLTNSLRYENNEESNSFIDLWGCLHGDLNNGVNKHNLRTFLAAIQGFNIPAETFRKSESTIKLESILSLKDTISFEENKYGSNSSSMSLSNQNTARQKNDSINNVSDSRDTTKFICFEVGEYDMDGILKLSMKDIRRTQKYFILLSRNRSKFLKERKLKVHQQRNKFEMPSYKPKISKRSELLVKGILNNLVENKIPHYELLLYKGKEYQNKRARFIKEKEKQDRDYQKKLQNRLRQTHHPKPVR